ncbi:MAG: ribosome maturation factor RimM [Gammaproteobacteria bacterium]
MQQRLSLLNIGRIGRAHGIRGWVNIISFTQPVKNILSYQPWQLSNGKTVTVEASRVVHNGIIVKFLGCDDRDIARTYTNIEILIQPTCRPPLTEGDYYWTDLIGLTVMNQDGLILGEVVDLLETGSNDVLAVRGKKEHLIPYLLKDTIVDIDMNKKIIQVIWDPDF